MLEVIGVSGRRGPAVGAVAHALNDSAASMEKQKELKQLFGILDTLQTADIFDEEYGIPEAAGGSAAPPLLAPYSHTGERNCELLSFLPSGVAILRRMPVNPRTARSQNKGVFYLLTLQSTLYKGSPYLEFIQSAHSLFVRLTIRPGGQIFNLMRILLFITLMLSMAVAPAAAFASCASMGADMDMTQMSSDDVPMEMAGMGADDCANMNNAQSQSHDAGCMAACALVCPGFYSGPDFSSVQEPAFRLTQYAIPQTDPGLPTPSHLDPPPPRI